MMTARLPAVLALAALTSCGTHRVHGSMVITKDAPVMFRVKSVDPAEVDVEIQNRGPGVVHYEQLQPLSPKLNATTDSTDGNNLHWIATTKHFELQLTTDSRTTITYTLRTAAGGSLSIGTK